MSPKIFGPLLGTLLASSCGYVGPILPPSAQIPTAVKDLTAIQRGNNIEIAFHTPPITTDNLAIKQFSQIDLRIGPALTPFDLDDWLKTAKALPQEPPEESDPLDPRPISLKASIPIQAFLGQHVVIAVRTAIKRNEHFSNWSNRVALDIAEPLAAPSHVKAEAGPDGVVLQWDAVPQAAGYRIMRQAPAEAQMSELAKTEDTRFVDTASQFDTAYSYAVVALTEQGSESPASPAVSLTPVDTFPPAVPTGVTALPGPESIELSWQRSPEADTAGYFIYRSVDNGPFEKIGALINLPAFSDRAVEHGKTYRYQISSIDKKQNESAKSGPIEIAF